MERAYEFRDISSLTKFLKVLLFAGIGLAILSMFSSLLQLQLLSRGTFSVEEGQANDLREMIAGLLQVALYLFTAIVFARWILKANRNIRAAGAQGLRMTPGWAVGYFFIPIVCLWKPYYAMKDLWQASQSPQAWSTATVSPILPCWWTLWVFSNVLGQVSMRVTTAAKDLASLQTATWIQIVSEVTDVPLCIMAILVITTIDREQKKLLAVTPKS